jgi:DNA-directed RNA polymerase subunit RPC12/RpoP
MTSQDQSAISNGNSSSRAAGIHPNCPRCQHRMRVKQLSPAMLADFDDVVYGCERCGTEVKRAIERSSI